MKKFVAISGILLFMIGTYFAGAHFRNINKDTPQEQESTVNNQEPTTPDPLASAEPAQEEKTPPQPPPAPKPASVAKPKTEPAPAPPTPSAPNTPTEPVPAQPASCDSGSFHDQFLCLINNHRASQGKGKLSYNASLNTAAQKHSAWMQSSGTFSHTGENGSSFTDRCAAEGLSCHAENLAMGYSTAQKLFEGWKNSSGHNTNMLGPYTSIGLGLAGPYATSLFKR